MAKAEPKVKKFLEDVGVAESDVPDTVMDTLNELHPNELNAVKKVGDSLEGSGAKPDVIAKVH